MPTRMTTSLRSNLNEASRELSNIYYSYNRRYFPAMDMYRTFWDDVTILAMGDMMGRVRRSSFTAGVITGDYMTSFSHETLPPEVTIKSITHIQLRQPHSDVFCGVIPQGADFDTLVNSSKSVRVAVDQTIEDAYILGMVTRTVLELTEACSTVEQMRYVFPPTLLLLNQAGLEDMHTKMCEVRRAPSSMPVVSPYRRKCIRFLNTWFAAQQLIGTFDGKSCDDTVPFPAESMAVRLKMDVYINSVEVEGQAPFNVSFINP